MVRLKFYKLVYQKRLPKLNTIEEDISLQKHTLRWADCQIDRIDVPETCNQNWLPNLNSVGGKKNTHARTDRWADVRIDVPQTFKSKMVVKKIKTVIQTNVKT